MTNPPETLWQPTTFEGENIQVYSVDDREVFTEIGTFTLTDSTMDDSHIRVVRVAEDRIVIGYSLYDNDPGQNPLDEMDGHGKIYLRENNEDHEIADALGLDYEGGFDLYEVGDEAKDEAIRRTITELHYRRSPYNEILRFEDKDDHCWSFVTRYTYSYNGHQEEWVAHAQVFTLLNESHEDYVCVHGVAKQIPDVDEIAMELWRKGRLAGTIGNRWAVTVRWYGDTVSVGQRWETLDTNNDDYYRIQGVWVPDTEATKDIENLPEEERWPRALEIAKDACQLYSDWRNGNVYCAYAESFKPEEQDDDDPELWTWEADGKDESCGLIYDDYPYLHTQSLIQECLDDLIDKIKKEAEPVQA